MNKIIIGIFIGLLLLGVCELGYYFFIREDKCSNEYLKENIFSLQKGYTNEEKNQILPYARTLARCN